MASIAAARQNRDEHSKYSPEEVDESNIAGDFDDLVCPVADQPSPPLETKPVPEKSRDLASAGLRAANLSLIHMVLLFASPSLDSLSNALGLNWRPVRRLNASVGVMASLLLVHFFSCLSHSSIGSEWYEVFLRLHRSLAVLLVYGLWMHLSHKRPIPRIYLYSLLGICGLSGLFISVLMLRRHAVLSRGFPRATITQSRGAIIVTRALSRPLLVKAGQQINLCLFMPATSFRSLFQSHPFVVASWSDAPQSSLDLLIEPRRGLTQQLLVRSSKDPHCTCPAIFTGPYGISVPVGEYGVVLMIASGFGIVAQLPYLKQLLHGYNSRRVRTRRIHLVWELKTLDLPLAIERLLHSALDDDALDDGYILQISVYVEHAKRDDKISTRANVIKGLPHWGTIVQEEAGGKHIKRVQEEAKAREDIVVTALGLPPPTSLAKPEGSSQDFKLRTATEPRYCLVIHDAIISVVLPSLCPCRRNTCPGVKYSFAPGLNRPVALGQQSPLKRLAKYRRDLNRVTMASAARSARSGRQRLENPVDHHTNYEGTTMPPQLQTSCPDDECSILELVRRHRHQTREDMWDSVRQVYLKQLITHYGKTGLRLKQHSPNTVRYFEA
ncbi:Uncharacterized protein TPAR_08558 [Tolypocladium paradoxum]|uniref:FAD-binding FR-type domain-containing protein n=1 Tax=Tolypocladium paradoxum TaxID=94208 RepID=A0A2S4KM91_9HYPO|nr:Uncharacterized protein TPAR_08558 [Tolypocladium paradoxum]